MERRPRALPHLPAREPVGKGRGQGTGDRGQLAPGQAVPCRSRGAKSWHWKNLASFRIFIPERVSATRYHTGFRKPVVASAAGSFPISRGARATARPEEPNEATG
jgi:hypothetical protein